MSRPDIPAETALGDRTAEDVCTYVEASDFRDLLVSRRRLSRCIPKRDGFLGLVDDVTGECFLVEQDKIVSESTR